jgi:phospholipid/cholesterol/gamma-HCH transport system permease protein
MTSTRAGAAEPGLEPGPKTRVRTGGRLLGAVEGIGEFLHFCGRVARAAVRTRPHPRELVEQAWFIASVTILPTALVAIPFGAVIALQVGSLSSQLGAESFTGSSSSVAIIREGAPLATALMLAGAAGSAICADLGARTIREEIDALMTLGIDPVQRLVVPRVLAGTLVGGTLTGLVMGVGIAGGYVFNVILQGGTSGVYLESFQNLATLPDVYVSLGKGLAFGALAATVGSFKGLRAGGGPRGVGQAVNEAVVMTFLLLFAVNYLLTTLYFELTA